MYIKAISTTEAVLLVNMQKSAAVVCYSLSQMRRYVQAESEEEGWCVWVGDMRCEEADREALELDPIFAERFTDVVMWLAELRLQGLEIEAIEDDANKATERSPFWAACLSEVRTIRWIMVLCALNAAEESEITICFTRKQVKEEMERLKEGIVLEDMDEDNDQNITKEPQRIVGQLAWEMLALMLAHYHRNEIIEEDDQESDGDEEAGLPPILNPNNIKTLN